MVYDIGIAIIGMGAGALLVYLGLSVRRHIAMQVLFGGVGLFIISLTLGSINEIALAEDAPSTTITLLESGIVLMTTIIRVSAVYLMIMFLWYCMKLIQIRRSKNKERRM